MLDSKPAVAHKWTDEEMLECVSVLPESPNVVTVCFQAPSGRPFEFLAGQFLTLELPVPGGPLYRTYTISSSPTRPKSITVTIKAQQLLDAGAPSADLMASVAKAKVAKTARLAVQEGVQMHGGIGMTDEYDIGLYMKRDRALAEFMGDVYYHADRVARLSGY